MDGHSTQLYYDDESQRKYNEDLSRRRCLAVKKLIEERLKALNYKSTNDPTFKIIASGSKGAPNDTAYPKDAANIKEIVDSVNSVLWRRVDISITGTEKNKSLLNNKGIKTSTEIRTLPTENYYSKTLVKDRNSIDLKNSTEGMDSNYESITNNYFMPVFHSQTPEDYHRRLTFLQQCTRQGAAQRTEQGGNNIRNSVFGRQPICILRIGDFFFTKIIINSINFSYKDSMWDLNPEGFGLQPIMCDVTMNIKIIGGQSLKGPIDLLQNAISFNYYANSTFTDKGIYSIPKSVEKEQFKQSNLDKTTKENKRILTNYLNSLPKTNTTK